MTARALAHPPAGPHIRRMLSYTFLDGFTDASRPEAIRELKEAIAEADGVITDFAYFSEAIRLSVELEGRALVDLRRALEARHVTLFERSASDLSRALQEGGASQRPVLALLHVALMPQVLAYASTAPAA